MRGKTLCEVLTALRSSRQVARTSVIETWNASESLLLVLGFLSHSSTVETIFCSQLLSRVSEKCNRGHSFLGASTETKIRVGFLSDRHDNQD